MQPELTPLEFDEVATIELTPFEVEVLRLLARDDGGIGWNGFVGKCRRDGQERRRQLACARLIGIGLLDGYYKVTPAGRAVLEALCKSG